MSINRGGLLRQCARHCIAVALLYAWLGLASAATGALDQRVEFDIAPQPLTSALLRFSRQTGLQLITSSVELGGLQTPGVHGEYSAADALTKLLENTGLVFSVVGTRTVAITRNRSDAGAVETQHSGSISERARSQPAQTPTAPRTTNRLEEIIVTARKREEALQSTPLSRR